MYERFTVRGGCVSRKAVVAGVSPTVICGSALFCAQGRLPRPVCRADDTKPQAAAMLKPQEQAGELDAVDTTTYFRRYHGKRTNEERDFRDRR